MHCEPKKIVLLFYYNADVSWWLFILFVLVKTGVKTLHFTYLIAW